LRILHFSGCFIVGLLLSSCAAYKQNIMFRVNDKSLLKQQLEQAETNYSIRKNDILQLDVYTNRGEKIIDPNLESFKQSATASQQETSPVTYLVDITGTVRFPMIGELKAEGLTIRQAEEILQKEYAKFYEEPLVTLKIKNKRVVVLGAPGGQVIPLVNENTHLTEVLALAKGITTDSKAHNIRVLRKDQIFLVDFSTFEGYLKNNMIIQPDDIVYVEPVRRPFSEGLREYGPVISIITSIGTLIVILVQVNKP
jgi:polysaccharide export outer membrane protein